MRKTITGFKASVVVIVTLAVPMLVHADVNRTWVSGVGDDVNPCSRTTPCKTFQGAMAHTLVGGEVNCIDPGGFGATIITKSITIDGTGCFASIISGATNAIVINISAQSDAAKTVRLRGLSIDGQGIGINGIRVVAAKRVFIEDFVIDGFSNHGITVEAPDANVFVKNTTIRNVVKNAINVQPTGNAPTALWIDRASLLNNFIGVFAGKGGRATIRDSDIIQSKGGAVAEKGELNIVNCLFTENALAINARAGSAIRLSQVTVMNNDRGLLASDDGKIISFGNIIVHFNLVDGAPTVIIPPP